MNNKNNGSLASNLPTSRGLTAGSNDLGPHRERAVTNQPIYIGYDTPILANQPLPASHDLMEKNTARLEDLLLKAEALAHQLGGVLNHTALPRLQVTAEKLVFLTDGFAPVFVDFNAQSWQKRHREGKSQGLIRACQPAPGTHIIDATAGWGRDAAVLASFGARVLMLERHPVIGALLRDGLMRLDEQSPLSGLLTLCEENALNYLTTRLIKTLPDVIYIDPMHPKRQKSALVKKNMQILQSLLAPDQDALTLIELSKQYATKRVVVKWPQREKPLIKPNLSIPGKTVRFDVYLCSKLA